MQHQTRKLILILFIGALAAESACAPYRIDDAGIEALPKQHPVVVINFWATWCEPCVEEIPILVKLQQQHPRARFFGISMDESSAESEQQVRKFVRDHGIPYRVMIRQGADFEAMVNSMDPDWIGGLPATFVFRDGKRVFSKTGPVKEQELADALKF